MVDLKDIIADRLSILCGGPRTGSPCGCMGLKCGDITCAQWWIFAFTSKEIYEKAKKLYLSNQRNIEGAVSSIILKKYIL
jgi:hypothetical protein